MMQPLYKFILSMMLLLLPTAGQAEEIFAKLAENKQVQSTYVSGRFAHNMKTWSSRTGQHVISLSDGFSSLYNYQCYSTESVTLARKILKEYLEKDKGMELVMRSNSYGTEYMVYEKFNKDDKLMRMLIWSCEAPNVCELVVVDWKNGLERKTSSVPTLNYLPGNFNAPVDIMTLTSLENLSGLSDLQELSKLSELSGLYEFNDFDYTLTIE